MQVWHRAVNFKKEALPYITSLKLHRDGYKWTWRYMSQSVLRRWICFLFTSWGDVSLSIPILLKKILKDNTRVSDDIRLHFEQLLQVTENLQNSFIRWWFQAPSITVRICPVQVEFGEIHLSLIHTIFLTIWSYYEKQPSCLLFKCAYKKAKQSC